MRRANKEYSFLSRREDTVDASRRNGLLSDGQMDINIHANTQQIFLEAPPSARRTLSRMRVECRAAYFSLDTINEVALAFHTGLPNSGRAIGPSLHLSLNRGQIYQRWSLLSK